MIERRVCRAGLIGPDLLIRMGKASSLSVATLQRIRFAKPCGSFVRTNSLSKQVPACRKQLPPCTAADAVVPKKQRSSCSRRIALQRRSDVVECLNYRRFVTRADGHFATENR